MVPFTLNLSDRLALVASVETTFQQVARAVRMLTGELTKPEGFFCFYTEHAELGAAGSFDRHLQLAMPVGNVVDFDRAKRVETNAFEKASRLGFPDHRHHVSSWITRNPSVGRYGGAIRVLATCEMPVVGVFSFSGLPEHGDEALLLSVAEKLGYATWVKEIIATSGNELASRFVETEISSPPPLQLLMQ